MSSSDYTLMRRINHINCRTTPVYDCVKTTIVQNTGNRISSTTPSEYLLTPQKGMVITVTIGKYLSLDKDTPVICYNKEATQNYFEADIYKYVDFTGEITLYNLNYISGIFVNPATYVISTRHVDQEFDRVRDSLFQLYQKVYEIDINDPNAFFNNVANRVTDVYKFLFGIDITTTSDYIKEVSYLEGKVNSIYEYFFDIVLTPENTQPGFDPNKEIFNPNNNQIALTDIYVKISQLYLYFFGVDDANIALKIV